MKMTEIADRIYKHLKRFENDPKINHRDDRYGVQRFFNANAYRAGNRVSVIYISYQGFTNLTKDEALEYLKWLDAGNVGTHYEMQHRPLEGN